MLVLITGCAGFIGFHTALALQSRGVRVVGLDNFNDYYAPKLKERRAALLEDKGIKIHRLDLSEVDTLFTQYNFTHVLNLAAQAGVRYARKNPHAYIHSNIQGFLSLLEALKTRPHIKLVYASSSSVYGCNEKVPFSEKDHTDKPANLYAATKKANELMAYSYHHLYGIEAIGLRYFTVYGPWGRPDMAYFSFTEAIVEGRPIHLFNEGKMRRDFTYIDDAVAATLQALEYKGSCEVFNIGNHHVYELMTLVSILEKELGKEAIKVFEAPSAGEMERTYADISLAQEKLCFAPKTCLEEGLTHFIQWYKSTIRVPRTQEAKRA
ncbi:MAG: NAD-dependent epimerase/dehydratase family protein [Chlamydiales bacterium]